MWIDKNPEADYTYGICSRRTLWQDTIRHCHGKMKRYNCNLALADLPEALERHCLFLNKFGLEVDGSVVTCLYEHLTSGLVNYKPQPK